jgi:hypothetical protein
VLAASAKFEPERSGLCLPMLDEITEPCGLDDAQTKIAAWAPDCIGKRRMLRYPSACGLSRPSDRNGRSASPTIDQ